MMAPLQEHWNEKDWERELRRDDERIAAYFRELPQYIDLPAEDDIIYHSLRKQKRLVPADGYWHNVPPPDDPEEWDDGDAHSREEWLKREGASSYLRCGNIARRIAAVYAAGQTGMAEAVFLIGRTMARLADIISMEDGEMPAMRVALAKRFNADINRITGLLKDASDPDSEELRMELLVLRHEITEILFRY